MECPTCGGSLSYRSDTPLGDAPAREGVFCQDCNEFLNQDNVFYAALEQNLVELRENQGTLELQLEGHRYTIRLAGNIPIIESEGGIIDDELIERVLDGPEELGSRSDVMAEVSELNDLLSDDRRRAMLEGPRKLHHLTMSAIASRLRHVQLQADRHEVDDDSISRLFRLATYHVTEEAGEQSLFINGLKRTHEPAQGQTWLDDYDHFRREIRQGFLDDRQQQAAE